MRHFNEFILHEQNSIPLGILRHVFFYKIQKKLFKWSLMIKSERNKISSTSENDFFFKSYQYGY